MIPLPTTPTRYLLGVLVPGAFAAGPWLVLVQEAWVSVAEPLASTMVFVSIAVVGGVMESAASHLESRWDRKHVETRTLMDDWYSYLCRSSEKRVVFSYISRLVDLMYFELAMIMATVFGGAGLVTLVVQKYCGGHALWLVPVLSIVAFYFRWQARMTHQTLFDTRRELATRSPTDGSRFAEDGRTHDGLPL